MWRQQPTKYNVHILCHVEIYENVLAMDDFATTDDFSQQRNRVRALLENAINTVAVQNLLVSLSSTVLKRLSGAIYVFWYITEVVHTTVHYFNIIQNLSRKHESTGKQSKIDSFF